MEKGGTGPEPVMGEASGPGEVLLPPGVKAKTRTTDDLTFTRFPPLKEIYLWMWKLAEKNPSSVSKLVVGTSYEGREIRGLRIFPSDFKPILLIEGGIHAQEWLSTSTAVCIIQALLHSPKNNVADRFEWHIFPSINPDGYEYSFSKNRTWRKTRSRGKNGFYGVDANRNWDFAWSAGEGSSRFPQSRTYPGPSPFSEPETRALATHVLQSLARLHVYVALHCSSQCILIPWGYTRARAPDHDQLMEVALKAGEAFESTHGKHPSVGPVSTTLYLASGNSVDWAYSKGVKFSFAFELRHVKPGLRHHEPDEIVPTAQETLNAIFVILEESLAHHTKEEAKSTDKELSSKRWRSSTRRRDRHKLPE